MSIKDYQNKFRELALQMEEELGGCIQKVTVTRKSRFEYEYPTDMSIPLSAEVIYQTEITFDE